MSSLKFPDSGTRLVIGPNGRPAVNATAYLYADEELTVPAEVYHDTDGTKGALIGFDTSGRRAILLNAYGEQPNYWGPEDGTPRLWIVINGVASVVNADYGERINETQTALNDKVSRGELTLLVEDFGAVGDGATDDTAAIQAAVNAASASKGLVSLNGVYRVSSTINLRDGVTVVGVSNKARINVPAGVNFPAFLIDGVRAHVHDVMIVKAAGANAGSSGFGILVAGASDGSTVTGVTADGMVAGFKVDGASGTVPGTVKRIVFDRCRANASVTFGFEINECDGVELVHCSSVVSGLDGAKLRRKTKNVVVTGGYYTGAVGGDGMDCYAGGQSFTIQGTVFSGNTLNGLVVKNDDLNRTDPATYGIVGTINLVGLICENNGGSGVTCHRNSGNPDDPTEPLVSGVNIIGGQYNNNYNYGLYLNARRVTVTGVGAARNGLDGVYLEPTCLDVDLIGIHAAGNSRNTTGTSDGIRVAGDRIRVIGGSSHGSDPDGATNDADVAAGTKTQRYGMSILTSARNIDVYGLRTANNLTGHVLDSSGSARWAGPSAGFALRVGWYFAPGGTRTTVQMASAVEYAVPVYLTTPGTIVRLGVEVTIAGTSGTTIRLGVRDTSGNLPGSVLGEVTVAGDAVTGGVEGTVAIDIPTPGIYWFTATAQNTGSTLPTVRATNGPTGINLGSGSLAATLGATPNGGFITAATVTDVLPSTYTVLNRAGGLPLVAARA